ncbi:MAG TPA: mycothiol conjugate amidase Mca [Candidatus Tectomicrobia bacterium]
MSVECSHDPLTCQAMYRIVPEPEVLRAAGNPTACTRRLLTIHAHPDDESSKGGGSVVRYAAAGVGTVLICCTGGEAGSIENPALKHPEVQARLAPIRRAELATATTHLGYQRVWMLGYRDSNMPASGDPGTFAAAPLEETVQALVRLIRQERPHVVVTYPDDQRGYQHPDHLRVHDASIAAYAAAGDTTFCPKLGAAWTPQKLYYVVWSRARLVAHHEAFVRLGLQSPYNAERWKRWPSRDYRLTTRVFIGDYWEQVQDALRAHATQIDPQSLYWFGLPSEVARTTYPYDDYILAQSTVPTTLPEDDLFAGVVADQAQPVET